MKDSGNCINEFDNLIIKSVKKAIREDFGYAGNVALDGMINLDNARQGENELELVCDALRRFFGRDCNRIMSKTFKSICHIDGVADPEGIWLVIHDREFMQKIIMALEDVDLKRIIDVTSPVPLTADEIMKLVGNITREKMLEKIGYLLSENLLTVASGNNQRRYKSIIIRSEIIENNIESKMRLLVDSQLQDSIFLRTISADDPENQNLN